MKPESPVQKFRKKLREITFAVNPQDLIDKESVQGALELVQKGKYLEARNFLLNVIEPENEERGYTLKKFIYLLIDEALYEEAKEILPERSHYPPLIHLKPLLDYLLGIDPKRVEETCQRNLGKYAELGKAEKLTEKQADGLKKAVAGEKQLIGILKVLQGDVEGAIAVYKESYEIKKLPETAFDMLACSSRIGDEEEARRWLEILMKDHDLGQQKRILEKCKTDAALDRIRDLPWFRRFLRNAEGAEHKKA